METVLVLNANFEPINICSMRRAIGLMLLDRATLVVNGRGVIHTVSTEYPKPSIIRLQSMVKCPRPHVHLTRKEVFRRDSFTCQYCGKRSPDLTIDHVIPKHLGGDHSWENVVTACSRCNHLKGGRLLSHTHLRLHCVPKSPPQSAFYYFGKHLKNNHEWEPFISGW